MKNKLYLFLALLVFFSCLAAEQALSQEIPDLSTINVDDLSDDQISQLLSRANSAGYSTQEVLQLAQVQGMPTSEVAKLSQRISQMSGSRVIEGRSYPGERTRGQNDWELITDPAGHQPEPEEVPLEEKIFGFALFSNANARLTFEPNLNLPTPRNYILGPGDVLYIDIYGASEQYFEARVNSEGRLLLANFGPVPVSGLTIEQAAERIKSKLAAVYTGIKAETPNTFVNVSLGTVRTIKVNIVGEVRMPGTFTLSSLASVFNALYVAGGVTTNGTLRNIKVFRANKLIKVVDAYDFLVGGQSDVNIQLADQDVIIVDPYTARVEVQGEVKRPGIFELKGEETLSTILAYAGGFTDEAYQERLSVTRKTNSEKVVADVFREQFELFEPKGGDVYKVSKILDRFSNRVQIKGAVFREGNYSLSDGLTVTALIKRAEGLTGDANLSRAIITRNKEDLTTETISFDLAKLLNGEQPDIVLQREDVVTIFSKYDLKEEYYVTIAGEVNHAGVFPFSDGMTVEDLIAKAKGLREAASQSNIEITRRVKDQNARDISEIILIQVDKNLALDGSEAATVLEPFDHVIVRRNPNYRVERFVRLEGEILFPGPYAITNVNERISDVVKRAGGLTEFAYPKGATLIRRTEFFENEPELARKLKSLKKTKENIEKTAESQTESDRYLAGKIDEELYQKALDLTDNDDLSSYAKRERLKAINVGGPFSGGPAETEIIGINLEEIIARPGSKYDLILEEGDVISIPKQLQTVRLAGRVLYPTTVRYEDGKSLRYFITRAGGFDSRAKKNRTYVIYANGEVARTKSFLFIRNYPGVEPGADIIVPVKPIKVPLKPAEIIGATSGLATIALLITQIFRDNP